MDRKIQNAIARNIMEAPGYLRKLKDAVSLCTSFGRGGRKLKGFHRYNRIHGKTVGLVKEYFLSFDYSRLSEAELKELFCRSAEWLDLCISWPGRREFIKGLLDSETVPYEIKSFALYLALMEGWADLTRGPSWGREPLVLHVLADTRSGEEDLAVSLDGRPASGVAIFMDMAGIGMSRWLLSVFIIKGRADILQLLLDRDPKQFRRFNSGKDVVERIIGCAKDGPCGRYGDAPLGIYGAFSHSPEKSALAMWELLVFARKNFPEELSSYCAGFDLSRISVL